MEGGVGEDRVDVAVELEVEQVADLELDPLIAADRLAGLGDHRPGRVLDHPALGKPLEQQLRHPAAAAARVQHGLVAAKVDPGEHLASSAARSYVTASQSVTVKGSWVSAPRGGAAASNASMAAADRSVIPMSSSPFRSRCLASSSISKRTTPRDSRRSGRRGRSARPGLGDPTTLGLVEDHRQQSDLHAVAVEDVGERGRDHGLEAEVLKRPRGVLARGPAAEVGPGHEDGVGLELDFAVADPVVEQELAEAGSLDPLQELLRDDLVGVHVGAVEHRDRTLDHVPLPDVDERTLDGGRRCAGDTMRGPLALAALEVAVRRRCAALPGSGCPGSCPGTSNSRRCSRSPPRGRPRRGPRTRPAP